MNGTNGDFMTLTAAATRVGVHRKTLGDRVRLGMLPSFSDPRDRRFVLVRVADVEGMNTPCPRVSPREEATTAT